MFFRGRGSFFLWGVIFPAGCDTIRVIILSACITTRLRLVGRLKRMIDLHEKTFQL